MNTAVAFTYQDGDISVHLTVGCVLFIMLLWRKWKCSLTSPGIRCSFWINMPVTALPDCYVIRGWALLANLQQMKFEIRMDIQELKPLQVKSLWKARQNGWRVTDQTSRQEGDLWAEGVICTSRSRDEPLVRQTKEVAWQAHSKAQRWWKCRTDLSSAAGF